VPAAAAIDVGALGLDPGEPLRLLNLRRQRVPVRGLPGSAQMPTTNCPPGALAFVVASETFTPNS
jgi:hypothetical protein